MSTLKLIGRLAAIALAAALAFNATAAKRDFDGDGKADVLWISDYDENWATYAIWLMEGAVPVVGSVVSQVGPNPRLFSGDLNRDGAGDIVAGSDFGLAITLMQGISKIDAASFSWELLLARDADFDGDGRTDLLWRSGGESWLWLMAGTFVKSSARLAVTSDWTPQFSGDFNGDGKSDIVWRNSSTGETALWLMDGEAYLGGSIIMTRPFWTATPAGDLDADGKDDLAWRNSVTGETALWLMNGTARKAGSIVVTDANWATQRFGDLNGDGRSDIVWENSVTGATHVWLMDGLMMIAGAAVPLNGASVVVVDDFDGDGRDDFLTAYDQPTPGLTTYSIWLMDGLNVKSSADLLTSDAWTVLP